MKIRYLLILILWFSTSSISLGIFGAIKDGFEELSDPCNAFNTKERTEKWKDEKEVKFKPDLNCPPYAKTQGRKNYSCLVNATCSDETYGCSNYPKGSFFEKLIKCAESVDDEHQFFTPKIKIRHQTCNATACWSNTKTLNKHGHCIAYPGAYGVPFNRFCARVALPEYQPTEDAPYRPADHGYTDDKHLDGYGDEVDDEKIYDLDGNEIELKLPKFCAYYDYFTLVQGETVDWSGTSQPIHKNSTAKSPVAEVIIKLLDLGLSLDEALENLIESKTDSKAGGIVGKVLGMGLTYLIGGPFLFILNVLFEIPGVKEGFEAAIREVFSLNLWATPMGCANIPLGPYPPPFCESMPNFEGIISIKNICQQLPDGSPERSTRDSLCAKSYVDNNFVHNAVRVGFDKLLPLCSSRSNNLDCVNILNLPSGNASVLHSMTSEKDLLPNCGSGSGPCISGDMVYTCSQTSNGCNNGFRAVYAEMNGSENINILDHYNDDLEDCDGSNSTSCQIIWGANVAEFKDVELKFPSVQTHADMSDISTAFTLNSLKGNIRNLEAKIVRASSFSEDTESGTESNEICISENGERLGCLARAAAPLPSVYDCSSNYKGISCSSDNYNPSMIAAIEVGSSSTAGFIDMQTILNQDGINSNINLGGNDYTSFVTNNESLQQPFSGPKSINLGSIYGTYVDDIAPYDSDLNFNDSAIYMSGLEYLGGLYIRGGTLQCLSTDNLEKCPEDINMCVLTNLKNRDLVDCSAYFEKIANYPGIGLCSAEDTGCTLTSDYLDSKSGGEGIKIYSCSAGYCYSSFNDEAVCTVTSDPVDRHIPASSNDIGVPIVNEYYDADASNFDKNLYALRSKTADELGLCAAVPEIPDCQSVTTASEESGYATWISAEIGKKSTGTCASGYIQPDGAGALERMCLTDPTINPLPFLSDIPEESACATAAEKIRLVSRSDNLPASYTQNSERKDFPGYYTFTDIVGGDGSSLAGLYNTYNINLQYEIDDITKLQEFKFRNIVYRGEARISVNGNFVVDNDTGSSVDPHIVNDQTVSEIDIMQYLNEGINNIQISIATRVTYVSGTFKASVITVDVEDGKLEYELVYRENRN